MADYWKSIDKKYCDVCKCWITDNKASVAFHENGNRHKMAIQQRLKDIHKKNKSESNTERKLANEMRKIEAAANAASKKDMEANPDVSMKIQTFYNMLKKDEGEEDGTAEGGKSAKKTSGSNILHRSDKQKKADNAVIDEINKPTKSYNRLGGWDVPKSSSVGDNYLELPKKNTKSPGSALLLAANKAREETPISFGEKRAASSSASSSSSGVKTEPSEVVFKKRKLPKGNMRQRGDDD